MPLADIGADHPRGEEPARIVDHDRRLADRPHVIERHRKRLLAGLLAQNDLDQHHLLDRREEVNADELRRPLGFLGERGDRQGRRIGPEHHAGADRGLGPGDGLGLDGAVLEHRFDHEITAAELAVIGGRLDAGKQRVAIRGADAALGDLVADQLLGIGLAFFGGLLIAIRTLNSRVARTNGIRM